MFDPRSIAAVVAGLVLLSASASANCAYAEQKAFWQNGSATCSVSVTNNCPRPIVCDVVMRGTALDGRPVSDRKSGVSVAPDDTISAGLTGVASCGNWRWSCR